MEERYRDNLVELAAIYNNTDSYQENNGQEKGSAEFISFLYKELFDLDIIESGYGIDNSTKLMTNDMGDLKIYLENDANKIKYLNDIKMGDLVFFHTKSLDEQTTSPSNSYPGHVGLYLGDNKFIHCSSDEGKIVIESITSQWLNILVGSRDIIKYILINK